MPEAIEQFQKALRIQPGHAEVHYNMGVVLTTLKRFPEAIEHFQEALKSKPDFGQAAFSLSSALAQSGRLPEAIQYGRRAVRLMPDNPQGIQFVARLMATDPEFAATKAAQANWPDGFQPRSEARRQPPLARSPQEAEVGGTSRTLPAGGEKGGPLHFGSLALASWSGPPFSYRHPTITGHF